MKLFFVSILFSLAALCGSYEVTAGPVIKGVVECNGKGIPGVVVSDGFSCVVTDEYGEYEMEASVEGGFVFVSTPAGYLPGEVKNGTVPVFYKSIEGPGIYNFSLKKNPLDDRRHVCFVQSDVQLVSEENLEPYRELLDDMNEYKSAYDGKVDVFGIDCGDIVGDTPSLFSPYLNTVSVLDMPVYRAIGNHDMDYYGRSYETSYSTFEGLFGPVRYSFNRGNVHYIVINNNFYIGREYFYIGYVDEKTFSWLEKDLSYVPDGSTVVLVMHMPSRLTPSVKRFSYDYPTLADQTVNAGALHGMFGRYNTHIISGHMHYNLNICFSETLMEHNTAAVCGTWWCAGMCLDGTPSGYAVYEADGDEIKWLYKSAGYPDTYQARAYLPGASPEYPECVVANVWNYDTSWKVEWCENGVVVGEMEQYSGCDPYAELLCKDRTRIKYDWIGPTETVHLFRSVPVDPSARIEVRVTDRFGNVYVAPAVALIYP